MRNSERCQHEASVQSPGKRIHSDIYGFYKVIILCWEHREPVINFLLLL